MSKFAGLNGRLIMFDAGSPRRVSLTTTDSRRVISVELDTQAETATSELPVIRYQN